MFSGVSYKNDPSKSQYQENYGELFFFLIFFLSFFFLLFSLSHLALPIAQPSDMLTANGLIGGLHAHSLIYSPRLAIDPRV